MSPMSASTTPSTAPNAFTREWDAELERLERRIAGLERAVSPAQANWKPAPDRWSIAECLAHLNATLAAYAPGMDAALARGRERGLRGGPPFAAGPLAGRFILRAMRGGPRRMKVPAPKVFRPAASALVWPAVAREQRELVEAMRARLAAAEGLDLGRIRMPSPAGWLVQLSLAQVFEIHALHGHRHLDQAERVRAAPGYPSI
jgi:hypothetical protein